MIELRPLRREDFGLLATWLAEPQVAYWWNHEWTPEAIERDFGAVVDGTEPTEVFVAEVEGEPFGIIQRYAIAAYGEYVEELTPLVALAPGVLSVDYMIGVPERRGQGLGAEMIRAVVERSWTDTPDAQDVIVPVSAGNVASWRALETAGFVRVAEGELEPDNPAESRDHVVYRCVRP